MTTPPKTTRKELMQPDQFQVTSARALGWMTGHQAIMVGILVVALLGAGGGWFYVQSQQEKALKMEALYFQMTQIREKDKSKSSGETLGKLKDLLGQFEEGSQKTRARLVVADVYFQNRQYEDAAGMYKEISDKTVPGDMNRSMALSGLGYSYEALKKYSDATKVYKTLLKNPGNFPVFYIHMSLARSNELSGDSKSAIQVLRDMQNKFANHADIQKVNGLLNHLEGPA